MRLLPRYVTPKNRDVGRSITNMIHPEFCRNWQRCERRGGGGGNGCIGMVFPPASCLQSGSVVALCYLAFLGLVSHWRYPGKAACGEGMILEKMFDEVKDIFSCQCVALTNSVHHWRRKQSLWWEEKVGRRPASLQGEGRPSFTGRTCRTTADEPLLKTCKGNSPL